MLSVKENSVYLARFNNDTSHAFMCFECATAIDILTLVIALFSFTRNIAAAFGVSSSLAFRAMHHLKLSLSEHDGTGCLHFE